jgi:hypothetical protein
LGEMTSTTLKNKKKKWICNLNYATCHFASLFSMNNDLT